MPHRFPDHPALYELCNEFRRQCGHDRFEQLAENKDSMRAFVATVFAAYRAVAGESSPSEVNVATGLPTDPTVNHDERYRQATLLSEALSSAASETQTEDWDLLGPLLPSDGILDTQWHSWYLTMREDRRQIRIFYVTRRAYNGLKDVDTFPEMAVEVRRISVHPSKPVRPRMIFESFCSVVTDPSFVPTRR